MRFYIETLGCKVNQYETQALAAILEERGHTAAQSAEGCDVCIINTCAVTAESGRKSRQAVRRAKRAEPDALIAVCGCFSQVSPEEIAELGADLVAGSGERRTFIDELEALVEGRGAAFEIDNALKRRLFEELPSGSVSGRTRAMLKIQDGCSNFCTYCIIPYARGPVRSLPIDRVREQAKKLHDEGYCEIVVTGIEISSYGKDLGNGASLISALCEISAAAPDCRIRLGSLEPGTVTEEFVRQLAALKNICPHFHLSLQSGCDATLARMHRKYDTARFFDAAQTLRRYFKDCGITADLIVGFPGETEEEFSQTLEFIRKCAFSAMHIFPYSQRPGTPAATMDGQLDKRTKQERARLASAVAVQMEQEFLRNMLGKRLEVLFERDEDGVACGHAGNYPEVHINAVNVRNTIRSVQISAVEDSFLWGELTDVTV